MFYIACYKTALSSVFIMVQTSLSCFITTGAWHSCRLALTFRLSTQFLGGMMLSTCYRQCFIKHLKSDI